MIEHEDGTLRELAARLGGKAAARLDVERTKTAVLEGLRAAPSTTRRTWAQPAWLRIAAALAILVGGGYAARQLWPENGHRGAAAHFIADDLSDFSAAELQDVLATLDETLDLNAAAPDGGADLDELDAQQLRAVLRSLEG